MEQQFCFNHVCNWLVMYYLLVKFDSMKSTLQSIRYFQDIFKNLIYEIFQGIRMKTEEKLVVHN